MDLDELDLYIDTAAGDVRDPYPEYAEARRNHPVQETSMYGITTLRVARYDDVAAMLRDPATFSSRIYGSTMGLVMGPTILAMDGSEHRLHRALAAKSFRRSALEAWQPRLIEPTVHALIDGFARRGRAELVREFTIRFPIRIIARLLGIPSEDYGRFTRLSIDLISIAVSPQRGLAASASLKEYFSGLLEERRRHPRHDLVSELATAEVEGERLPDEEIFGFLRLLLPAGAETTYRLLGNLLFGLLTEEAQLKEVREDRSLLPAAIEEALRWEAPVQLVSREPVRDVEIAGVSIRAGTHLTGCLGSANRDETRFDRPDRFDLHRTGPAHLAFAEGPHRCLGEHLARLETTVAMNALLDRLPDLRLDPGAAHPHVHGLAFRSPTSLPVTFAGA